MVKQTDIYLYHVIFRNKEKTIGKTTWMYLKGIMLSAKQKNTSQMLHITLFCFYNIFDMIS